MIQGGIDTGFAKSRSELNENSTPSRILNPAPAAIIWILAKGLFAVGCVLHTVRLPVLPLFSLKKKKMFKWSNLVFYAQSTITAISGREKMEEREETKGKEMNAKF